MADDKELKRIKNIIGSSNQLKRRYKDHVALSIKHSGAHGTHASTGGMNDSVRVSVNSDWSTGVSDNRLKATLYHESVHTNQRKRAGFMGDSTKSQREFHAHTEELRKAMKHNLYTPSELQSKKAKIKKYYEAVQAEGSGFKELDDQYARVQNNQSPSKITTKQLHQAILKKKP